MTCEKFKDVVFEEELIKRSYEETTPPIKKQYNNRFVHCE